MLRTKSPIKALGHPDRDQALEVCARDLPSNVFVAARILEGALDTRQGSVLAHVEDGAIHSLCWASANIVPVQLDDESTPLFAERLRRARSRCASVLGPQDQVGPLWGLLEGWWGAPRAVRARQPLMVTSTPPSHLGIPLDPRVRPARRQEVGLVLPAAAHMFTHEIGYAPYAGSSRSYEQALQALIDRGHTYVVIEDGRVLFKADIGSVALGHSQVQGVWLSPELRGRGLAVPMMAAVVEQVIADLAGTVTLYVNDFNTAAIATYRRIGMTDAGAFTTILL